MKTCIALDIESTGFDPHNDQVIEIAAVKFTTDGKSDEIIDRFQTLINPGIPIPHIITHITSIRDEDVVGAPTLESVKQQLETFIGNYPIVGHNIDFDVNFLKAKGVHVTGALYDTLQLSMILLPGLASYSLDTLGRILKLEHENKHRAMSDTLACQKLYCILINKISEIDEKTLKKIQTVIHRGTWPLGEIFFDTKGTKRTVSENENNRIQGTDASLGEVENARLHYEKTDNEILRYYSPDGKLSKILQNYESRPNQEHMAELILNSLDEHKKIIIEAGTGMGKTMAYMASAVHHSLKNGKKVVVSTYTHNLQEQLLKKDVPLLEKLFEPAHFEVAVVKGRRNYLSYKRLELLIEKPALADHEITLMIKIFLWLERSPSSGAPGRPSSSGRGPSGDLDELTFVGKEFSLLDEICCAQYACSHDDPEFANGCYLMKARQKAFGADIIIVNHALLLQDIASETPILPDYEDLIIDEAHHLEKVATDTFTVVLAFFNFMRPFEKLKKNLEIFSRLSSESQTIEEIRTMKQTTDNIIGRVEIFFGFVGIFLEKNLKPDAFNQLNLSQSDLSSKEWLQAKESGKNIAESAQELFKKITNFQEIMGEQKGSAWKEIKGYMYECEKKIADLKSILESDDKTLDQMTWINKSFDENVTIHRSPVDVGPLLTSVLWNRKAGIILTSATLRTDHTFNFIRNQLGIDQSFAEAALPSHFSYPDQVKILIPENIPEPATEGYFKSCANIIKNVIRTNGGRTLVLFTAKKALSATYHQIAPELKKEGFNVLAQQITGGRGKILEHFKDEPETSAIFGTQSFWEGIDLQGNDLNCVIIQKLPFDPPDDPMIVARSKKYRDPFNEYQLPRAILKFKQGFGRLIRSSTDTGTIIILDNRIIQKNYGHLFLQALPEGITIEYGTQENIHELLRKNPG